MSNVVPTVSRRKTCRLCESTSLSLAFSLTPTPPANAFVPKEKIAVVQERFPLDVFLCRQCSHLQLLDVVDPAILFRDYVYVSGTSPVFIEHFRKYAASVQSDYGIKAPGRVLEIGSNDGTLLRFFKEAGFDVLGIDPARNIAEQATKSGIPTLPEFFTLEMAKRLRAEKGPMSVVVANNVFAHIDDLTEVVRGVRELLDPRDGIYVFEVSYLADVIQNNLFDTIYHEHLSYHSIGPLIGFFERNGMQVIDAVRVDTHGGSLRVVAQVSGGKHSVSQRVSEMLSAEKTAGLYELETFKKFDRSIRAIGEELRALLTGIKKEGLKIAGFGAPAKATTLMYHFRIGPDLVDFIVDDSPLKQGLYSPGQHIAVRSSKAIEESKPDYLVLLAWNFADSIVAKNQTFLERGGHFVVPFPKVRIISKETRA